MTTKVIITPGNLNTDHFTIANSKVNLNSALINPFFTSVTLDTSVPGAPVYTFTRQDGTTTSVAANVNDVHLEAEGTLYDAASMTLTLALNDGSTDTIDLSELSKTTSENSTSVAFSGEGTAASPLSATVTIDAARGLSTTASGVGLDATSARQVLFDVELQDINGVVLMYGSSAGNAA